MIRDQTSEMFSCTICRTAHPNLCRDSGFWEVLGPRISLLCCCGGSFLGYLLVLSKENDHIFTLPEPLIILVHGFPISSCGYLGICQTKKKRLWNLSRSTFNKYPNTHPQTKHFSLDPCVFSVTDRVFIHFSEGFLPKTTPVFFVQQFPTFWGCLRDCPGICRNTPPRGDVLPLPRGATGVCVLYSCEA